MGEQPKVSPELVDLALDAYLAAETSGPGSHRKHARERMRAALEATSASLLKDLKRGSGSEGESDG